MPNEKITQINVRGSSYDVGGGDVTGVKGNSESEYRTGNVNITKANIGLGEVRNEDIGSTDISAIGATVKDAIVNLDTALLNKQDKTDNTLTTTSKTVVGAINEINTNLIASDDTVFDFTKSGNSYGYKDSNGTFVPFKTVQASKTVTAGTSVQTVTPDSGYDGIESVTVNPTPSQTKTVTGSRSKQTVTPDSGKLLSSVTVNKYPDATGTYGTITSNGTHDMGSTNNYRYVEVSVNVTKSVRLVISCVGHLAGVDGTTATVKWWGTAAVSVYVNGTLTATYTVTSGTSQADGRFVSNSDTPTSAGSSDKTY